MKRVPCLAGCQYCAAIRWLHLGYKPAEGAEIKVVSMPMRYSWIMPWCTGGLEELATKLHGGRPATTNDPYTRLGADVAEIEPQELGYNIMGWTIDRLQLHLVKDTGLALREAHVRALLKTEEHCYWRPKHECGQV